MAHARRHDAATSGPVGQQAAAILGLWSEVNRVVIPLPGRVAGFAAFLKGRMEAGQFRAVIGRGYPLSAVPDAYRYVETGQKVGIVVIDVAAADGAVASANQ